MVPVNVFPVCVICQLSPFIMAGENPPPIIDPLESTPVPTHVPVRTAAVEPVGPTGFGAPFGDPAHAGFTAWLFQKPGGDGHYLTALFNYYIDYLT